MPDTTSYGHWHNLNVAEIALIDVGRGPEPPDESERIEHYLTHPPQCGRPCPSCGDHPHCDVEAQVREMGLDVYGDLKPGYYRVRGVYGYTPGGPWGGPEYDIHLEVVPVDPGEAASDG